MSLRFLQLLQSSKILIIFLAFCTTSCGSYRYVGSNSDGIYGDDVNYQEQVESNSSNYYTDYFKNKSLEYSDNFVDESEIFTDINSYESSYSSQDYSDTNVADSYSGWGQNEPNNININVYDYRPFYNNWWRNPFYRNWGWNMGFNNWMYNANFSYGFWGNSFWHPNSFYNPYTIYNPYFGYPYNYGFPYTYNGFFFDRYQRNYVYNRTHRGAITPNGMVSSRVIENSRSQSRRANSNVQGVGFQGRRNTESANRTRGEGRYTELNNSIQNLRRNGVKINNVRVNNSEQTTKSSRSKNDNGEVRRNQTRSKNTSNKRSSSVKTRSTTSPATSRSYRTPSRSYSPSRSTTSSRGGRRN